jgi:hypothetical protein
VALKVGETSGIAHGLVATEVLTTVIGGTVVWVEETHIFALSPQLFEGDAMEALSRFGALGMHTDGIVFRGCS